MLLKRSGFVAARVALAAVASVVSGALLSGCASMVSSNEELQNAAANEGIVLGSFVINVEAGDANEGGWGFLRGQTASDATYAVLIS